MAQFDEYEAHRMEIERKLAFKAWREALTKKRQEKAKVIGRMQLDANNWT